MSDTIDFTPSRTFRRFKEVSKVKVNDEILEVGILNDSVVFYKKNIPIAMLHKDRLYERWVTKNDVLHYVQKVNAGLGDAENRNYVKAEVK